MTSSPGRWPNPANVCDRAQPLQMELDRRREVVRAPRLGLGPLECLGEGPGRAEDHRCLGQPGEPSQVAREPCGVAPPIDRQGRG
ncbi:MAG TPA: hypothetical protein VKP69_20175, partial [Isosphaeraceae bacterium]|nr:hypothetical protein [Isosphaeraceae bacterium]